MADVQLQSTSATSSGSSGDLLPDLVTMDLRGYMAAVDEGLPADEPSGPLFTALLLQDLTRWLRQQLRSSLAGALPRRRTRVPPVYWS
jgi:hypothetical protein